MAHSEFIQDKITKGAGQEKTFNKRKVYQTIINNHSPFEVTITSRRTGVITVLPGKPVTFFGHPQYPTDLELSIMFNAASAETDFITIETITAHGDFC